MACRCKLRSDMSIVIVFYLFLIGFLFNLVFSEGRRSRIIAAILVFGWSCLMFFAAQLAVSLQYNVKYGSAAQVFMDSAIGALAQGNDELLMTELKWLRETNVVSYERVPDLDERFREAAERLDVELQ